MSSRIAPFLAIINAARHVAADHIERAAKGELRKVPAFIAAVVLDATHAYVRLWGEPAQPVEDMGTIRSAPHEPAQSEHDMDLERPMYAMPVTPSQHGPN